MNSNEIKHHYCDNCEHKEECITLCPAVIREIYGIKGDNTCVSCGTYVPEGRQVCFECENRSRTSA